jgi:DNA polymerase I-like protein with 3'-5' exonuclease and polymerase domains
LDLALLNLAFTGPLVHLQELLLPLWRTEMPLVRVIVDMEAAGLAVNEAILNTGKSMRCGSGHMDRSWHLLCVYNS